MMVVVREMGSRPLISTPARLNAPQGASALTDMAAEQDWADMMVVTLDWEGDGFTPVMVVETFKWFIEYGGARLSHQWIIDMEDAFGADNMDNSTLRLIIASIREEFERQIEARRRHAE